MFPFSTFIFITLLHRQCNLVNANAVAPPAQRIAGNDAMGERIATASFSRQTAQTDPASSSSLLFLQIESEPDSYPVVLSAIIPKIAIKRIASRFDLIDAAITTNNNGDQSSLSSEGGLLMVQASMLIIDGHEFQRILSVLSDIYSQTEEYASFFSSVEINQSETNRFLERIEEPIVQTIANESQPQTLRSRVKSSSSIFTRQSNTNKYATISDDKYNCFRSLSGMESAMNDLSNDHPNLVTKTTIGKTYENHDIYAIKITASNNDSNNYNNRPTNAPKGKILLSAGVHPREYAPPELLMRFTTYLIDNYNTNADVTWILQHTEIHLIYYVNPDGRKIAEEIPSAYWRKNTNPGNSKDGCSEASYGVDVNRNFDFMWGDQDGASDDPCDETYFGTSPNSESETQALQDYAANLFPKGQQGIDPDNPRGENIMGVYIDVHAYGGSTYYPWGHEDKECPDGEAQQAFGRKVSSFNGHDLWAPGMPGFLYTSSGESTDYMYGVVGVAALGLEIGYDFYESCSKFEEDVVPKNLPALVYAARVAKKPFSMVKGPDVLELEAVVVDGGMRVTAVVSDDELVNIAGYDDFLTGDQSVSEVKLFLDVHPDDYQGAATVWNMEPVGSNREFVEVVISTSGLSVGRHVLYAQAKDSDDYLGPVSSIFINVEKIPTLPPTNQPSSMPTGESTPNPTQNPSASPTPLPPSSPINSPTSDPTKSPTETPSMKPSSEQTPAPSKSPSSSPTYSPSSLPSIGTTSNPSAYPSSMPTSIPSNQPSNEKTFSLPADLPTSSLIIPADQSAELTSGEKGIGLSTLSAISTSTPSSQPSSKETLSLPITSEENTNNDVSNTPPEQAIFAFSENSSGANDSRRVLVFSCLSVILMALLH